MCSAHTSFYISFLLNKRTTFQHFTQVTKKKNCHNFPSDKKVLQHVPGNHHRLQNEASLH